MRAPLLVLLLAAAPAHAGSKADGIKGAVETFEAFVSALKMLVEFGAAVGQASSARETPSAAVDAPARGADGRPVRLRRLLYFARTGNPGACYNLGVIHAKGSGVPRDYAAAVLWFLKAADKGHAEAQNALATFYRFGHGVPRNSPQALKWYRLAAAQGHRGARYNLATLYQAGDGVLQDKAEANRWFKLAAESAGQTTKDWEEVARAGEASVRVPGGIIDAHTHTDFTGRPEPFTGILDSRERYLEELESVGAIGAVSHTDENGAGYDDELRRKGVVFCAGVMEKPNLGAIEAGLKSGRYRCIKIYLGYAHRFAYDRAYRPVYKLAQRYQAPVVFHTGDPTSTRAKLKFADPLTIDEVAVDFSSVTFVIAHCGNPWIQSAAEVAYKNPNVVLECSAMMLGNLDKLPAEQVEIYMVDPIAWLFGYIEDPSKLMFGSDWPLADIRSTVRATQRAIPAEHWKAVFRDNAARVFKMESAKGSP